MILALSLSFLSPTRDIQQLCLHMVVPTRAGCLGPSLSPSTPGVRNIMKLQEKSITKLLNSYFCSYIEILCLIVPWDRGTVFLRRQSSLFYFSQITGYRALVEENGPSLTLKSLVFRSWVVSYCEPTVLLPIHRNNPSILPFFIFISTLLWHLLSLTFILSYFILTNVEGGKVHRPEESGGLFCDLSQVSHPKSPGFSHLAILWKKYI